MTSIEEALTHPTFPSSRRISFHSFIELSMISTRVPSWSTKRSVPDSSGVLFTTTEESMTTAPERSYKSRCCIHANTLANTTTSNISTAPKKPTFFNDTLLENRYNNTNTHNRTKATTPVRAQPSMPVRSTMSASRSPSLKSLYKINSSHIS